MAWTGLTLTVDGRNALNQAQQANTMNIKSVVIGDGAAPSNYNTRKELVHQLYELAELKIDMTNTGCNITADLPKVDYDYYFREIGVIVTTDDHDVLYVYDNCGEDAQYIINATGVEENQKRIRLSLVISDVSHITVSTPSMLYVAYDEFESKVNDLQDKKLDADGDASDAYVNFTYVKDLEKLVTGDKFSRAFGKIARAISDLMDHIKTVATSTIAGHVKLSNSSAITEAGQYALDAVEKNADVEGTLAYEQKKLKSTFTPASASTGGVTGLVPAPTAGKQNMYLRGDGTWSNKDPEFTGDILMKNASGNNRSIAKIDTSNWLFLGNGLYSAKEGGTNLCGKRIKFCVNTSKGNISFVPYYQPGESVDIAVACGGYITTSGKELHFSVTLERPLVNVSTISASSVSGLKVRQSGKYVYGSSSDVWVKPSSYSVINHGVVLEITAVFSTTTNAINNDGCGIFASIRLTFS
nr:MAG TPA: tail-collar fiber protein [Caudoviricetes sp.]